MKTSYIVERIDYKPGMSTDTDGEAVCLEEHDDRTWNKREFATELEARQHIALIRQSAGKWLASVKLFHVSMVEMSTEPACMCGPSGAVSEHCIAHSLENWTKRRVEPCKGCDGTGWQTGDNDGCICDYCDMACVCFDKPYDNSECLVHSIHERVSE